MTTVLTMRSILTVITLYLIVSSASAGDVDVAGFNLTENKEVTAIATKNGNPFSKTITFALIDGTRECSAEFKFKDVGQITTSKTSKGPVYVNNRPVVGATTERTRGYALSGFAAKGKMACSDDTILLCDIGAQPEGWKTIDGLCASPDESIRYRILAK